MERDRPEATPGRGDGSGKVGLQFLIADFLGTFPDRLKMTADTSENDGRGRGFRQKKDGASRPSYFIIPNIFHNIADFTIKNFTEHFDGVGANTFIPL